MKCILRILNFSGNSKFTFNLFVCKGNCSFFFRKSEFMKKVRIMRYKLKSEFFHLTILFYCVKKKEATFGLKSLNCEKIFILIPGIPYFNVNPTAIFVIGLVSVCTSGRISCWNWTASPSFPQQKPYMISSTGFWIIAENKHQKYNQWKAKVTNYTTVTWVQCHHHWTSDSSFCLY